MFFSEEKNQKTFMSCSSTLAGHGPDLSTGAEAKVFWFFSSEKNTLPLLLAC
jgi:hypothetical protein